MREGHFVVSTVFFLYGVALMVKGHYALGTALVALAIRATFFYPQ